MFVVLGVGFREVGGGSGSEKKCIVRGKIPLNIWLSWRTKKSQLQVIQDSVQLKSSLFILFPVSVRWVSYKYDHPVRLTCCTPRQLHLCFCPAVNTFCLQAGAYLAWLIWCCCSNHQSPGNWGRLTSELNWVQNYFSLAALDNSIGVECAKCEFSRQCAKERVQKYLE